MEEKMRERESKTNGVAITGHGQLPWFLLGFFEIATVAAVNGSSMRVLCVMDRWQVSEAQKEPSHRRAIWRGNELMERKSIVVPSMV
jgi:hypothetical protein